MVTRNPPTHRLPTGLPDIFARINQASALVLLIPSWLGLLGSWHWLLDLLAHFRWQYLLASLLVVIWATWQKLRAVAALAALTLALNATLIGGLALHSGATGEPDGEFSLRVLSFNVLTSNARTAAVVDHLMASDADVVFLMEIDQQWMTALRPLAAKYPYRVALPRADNFGVALFSRIPWSSEDILMLGAAQLPSIQVRLRHQGRELVLVGTHPLPPVGRVAAAWRDEQLELLATHVSGQSAPVLLVGDLNATPWSAGMRRLTAGNLDFRSPVPAWTPTWRARSLVAIPIDHALATAPLIISSRAVGPDLGSDHRPLQVVATWAASSLR